MGGKRVSAHSVEMDPAAGGILSAQDAMVPARVIAAVAVREDRIREQTAKGMRRARIEAGPGRPHVKVLTQSMDATSWNHSTPPPSSRCAAATRS